MKKLLITGSTFPRWMDDTEPRFILDYAKAMSKYYDVTVLAPAAIGAKDKEVLEGIKVERFHYFPIHKLETLCYPGAIVPRIKEKKARALLIPFLFLSMYLRLRGISKKYDIIHAHWLIPQGIVQSFVKNTPYIITGHGGDVTSLNNPLIKKLKRRCLKNAKKITVVSKALEEYVQDMYPNDKTSIISMGCDTQLFNYNKRRANYYNQGNKKVVLFVGRLAEKKGVTYLIDAMKYVDDAVLVIVGKGNLEAELKRQAEPLKDKVIFLGAKTHSELPEIYASADIFVAPSVTARDGDKEGFGLVIIEAMASGLPVIASNSGGIVDIINDGLNGMLVEEKNSSQIAECINELIHNVSLMERLVEQSRLTAEQFDYGNIAKAYHEIIEETGE